MLRETESLCGMLLEVVGVSDIVRDQEALFLTSIEKNIEVLDPAETRLVPDKSPRYRDSLLYLECLLRDSAPSSEPYCAGSQGRHGYGAVSA